MRHAIGIALILFIGTPSTGAAAEDSGPRVVGGTGQVGASHDRDESRAPSKSNPVKKRPQVSRNRPYATPKEYASLSYGLNGWCITRVKAASDAEYNTRKPANDARIEWLIQHGQTFDPVCLNPATQQSNNPAQVSLEAAVATFWADQRNLPVPVLAVIPEIGVTGLRTHLTISGSAPVTIEFLDPLLAEPIYIEAVPTYEITWGDGNIDTTTSNGGPDSELYNIYQNLGFYDIVVVAHWEATWRIGLNGSVQGELSGLTTESTLPRLQVDDIQAVEVPNS